MTHMPVKWESSWRFWRVFQPSKLSPCKGYDRIFTQNIAFLPTFICFYGQYVVYFRILICLQNCYIMANMKYYSSSSRYQYRLVCRRYPGWISAGALTVLTYVFHSFPQLFQALPRWCLRLCHNFLPLNPFQLIIHASSKHLILCSMKCRQYCLISHQQILVLQFFASQLQDLGCQLQ